MIKCNYCDKPATQFYLVTEDCIDWQYRGTYNVCTCADHWNKVSGSKVEKITEDHMTYILQRRAGE